MKRVLVDTSALLALLVPSDEAHQKARRAFDHLRAQEAVLVTTSYVLLEAYALLGRRFGLAAVRAFREQFAPLLRIVWVDGPLHDRGLDLLLKRRRAGLSLADAVSFVVAGEQAIDEAFAFDRHFEAEGLTLTK